VDMLKEKQRQDKRRFLEVQEEKYKQKLKGYKFTKEEQVESNLREKDIERSYAFRRMMKKLVKNPRVSERQMKRQFQMLDAKFTKECIREEKVDEQKDLEEKLKVKRDIYLSKEFSKNKRSDLLYRPS